MTTSKPFAVSLLLACCAGLVGQTFPPAGGGGGVSSVTGSANQTTCTPTTGNVVCSLASNTVLPGNPANTANSTLIATTHFVRTLLAALNPATAVAAATVTVLPDSPTYNNGAGTLTATVKAALVMDDYTVLLSDRVLINNQAAAAQNGVYTCTTLGTAGVYYVLTRATDFNTVTSINNAGVIPVTNGTVNNGTTWALDVALVTLGVSAINYDQTNAQPPVITNVNGVPCAAGGSCDVGALWDSNGLPSVDTVTVASQVDHLAVTPSATSAAAVVTVAATGSDTDIGLLLKGKDGTVNGPLGAAEIAGGNITSGGGSGAAAGAVIVHGGNDASSTAASQAGSVEIEGGASTNGGEPGLLILGQNYHQGATVTQWNMQCATASALTAQDCGASPVSALGVGDSHTGSVDEVHLIGSITPVNASGAVTLGHTVCAGSTAGKVTDSGGTGGCPTGAGFTVGTVVAVSGEWQFADGSSATITTTLPLVQIHRLAGLGNGDLASPSITVNGTTCTLGGSCTPTATTNSQLRTIGAVLTPTALTACVYVPFAGTVTAFHAVAGDGATADTVLVKVETQPTFATFISTGVSGASDISNGGEQLTSVLGLVDTTLSSWSTTLTAGTAVCFVGSTFSSGTSVNANITIAAN